MKSLVVILVAALGLAVGADADARPRRPHRVHAGVERAPAKPHVTKHRARVRVRRAEPRLSYSDEIALSPALMRQLQRNLVDGGYYSGAIDGALGARTRAALADFQREYHLAVSGHLNRATAEALLGRDAVASAGPRPRG